MKKRSYAKINLGLEVQAKRADGYHIVSMVMQSVDLCDELEITLREDKKIKIYCDHPDVPLDERNIAYKAAEYMIGEFSLPSGVDIRIDKKIPVAAGLAGGSGNCAAVIEAINELFCLGLDKDKMMQIGLRFGADVPFCIAKSPMLAEGIGEKLTPVKGLSDCYILISKPEASLSTAAIYKGLGLDISSEDEIKELLKTKPMAGLINALEADDMKEVSGCMYNRLEDVSMKLEPSISELKELIRECAGAKEGFVGTMMSGSGPSVFAIYKDIKLAEDTAKCIREKLNINEVFICRPI